MQQTKYYNIMAVDVQGSIFFRDRISKLYPGDQNQYQKQVKSIVERTAELFRRAVEFGDDIQKLMDRTLKNLGSDRQWIALINLSEDAEQFGVKRLLSATTPLKDRYSQYYQRLCALFHLRCPFTLIGNECHGKKPTIAFEVLHFESVQDWLLLFSSEDFEKNFAKYRKIYDACVDPTRKSQNFKLEDFLRIISDPQCCERLKQNLPNEYRNFRISDAIYRQFLTNAAMKCDFLLATSKLDDIELSLYLAPLSRDPMQSYDDIVIIHQDPFTIEESLKEIAQIFQSVIECDGEDRHTLQERVAHFEYRLAHVMPFNRGSAAVSEWMEMALYRFHGYQLTYNQEKMVNLEALTLTLDEFVKEYDSMIHLKRLD